MNCTSVGAVGHLQEIGSSNVLKLALHFSVEGGVAYTKRFCSEMLSNTTERTTLLAYFVSASSFSLFLLFCGEAAHQIRESEAQCIRNLIAVDSKTPMYFVM